MPKPDNSGVITLKNKEIMIIKLGIQNSTLLRMIVFRPMEGIRNAPSLIAQPKEAFNKNKNLRLISKAVDHLK